jgi:Lectin C-type domain
MSSPISRPHVVVRCAVLALVAACSYDLDRFVGSSGSGGAAGSASGPSTSSSIGSTGGSGGTAAAGAAGRSSAASTGGTTGEGGSGGTGGLAGGAGDTGVGGDAGTSSGGAGGAPDAGPPDVADSSPDNGSTMVGDEDAREAPADVAPRDASTDKPIDDACTASGCGSCMNTTECTCASYNGHVYRFCATARSFSDSQMQCALATMRLARIDDVFENAWVRTRADMLAMGETWIGIQDPSGTLKWQWPDGAQFWMGASNGSAVGGLFADWASGRPSGMSNRPCGSMLPSASLGQWFDRSCTSLLPYVCEGY